MSKFLKLVLQGLAAVLPIALTLYLIYWLLMKIELAAGTVLVQLLPAGWYFTGLGLLAASVFFMLVGLMVNAYGVRYLVKLGDSLLSRIPLVKSVHGAISDVMRVFSITDQNQAESVVLVRMDDNIQLIGFVTGRKTASVLLGEERSDIVGVYLPMSYQLGGYTVYVSSQRLTALNISVEDAMRIAVTGGVQNTKTPASKAVDESGS